MGENAAENPWVPVSGAQLKKQKKMYQVHLRKAESAGKKAEEKAAKEAADAEARDKNLAEAKKVVLEEDKSLPAAQKCKIRDAKPFRDQRIKVDGWIHRLRRQENDQNNLPKKYYLFRNVFFDH